MIEDYKDDAEIIAMFTRCLADGQATLRPQIPAMLERFQRTKKQRFSQHKRERLLALADRLLSPEFIHHMLQVYFEVDRAA